MSADFYFSDNIASNLNKLRILHDDEEENIRKAAQNHDNNDWYQYLKEFCLTFESDSFFIPYMPDLIGRSSTVEGKLLIMLLIILILVILVL